MFCQKCGKQIVDSSMFCEYCGAPTGIANQQNYNNYNVLQPNYAPIEDNEIVLQVKPTYNFVYMMVPSILSSFIPLLFMAIFAFFISAKIGFGVMTVVILGFILKYFLESKQYKNLTYDFYKTKIVYKDGFLDVVEKEVKTRYVREVVMNQGFIQRLFNLGNILIFTNAESGYGNGICIRNVENVEDVYKSIKAILNV